MELIILIALVVFVSTFIQTVSGFGIALVAMPILTAVIGIGVASPFVALIGMAVRLLMLMRYREGLRSRAMLRLIIASVIGVQCGGILFSLLDEHTMKVILGLVTSGYALYALLRFKLPRMKHRLWAIIMGFISGILAGAYNVGGPPVVIYAHCQRWDADEFRSNLQAFAMFNGITVLLNQWLNGRITALVWDSFVLMLPVVACAVVAGFASDRFVRGERFQKVVLVLLLTLGIQLLF